MKKGKKWRKSPYLKRTCLSVFLFSFSKIVIELMVHLRRTCFFIFFSLSTFSKKSWSKLETGKFDEYDEFAISTFANKDIDNIEWDRVVQIKLKQKNLLFQEYFSGPPCSYSFLGIKLLLKIFGCFMVIKETICQILHNEYHTPCNWKAPSNL